MGKIKVLLADDHVIVREGTRELVQRELDMEITGEGDDGEESVKLGIIKPGQARCLGYQ